MMASSLFVYGTLMPGQHRWAVLESFAAGSPCSAEVPGRLYRTPYGWPAAVFGLHVDPLVPGALVALEPSAVDEALSVVDAIEGVRAGLFERMTVTTTSGKPCWAYHWPGSTNGFEEIAKWG
jgi:gamma-glutamylcyclotransferase (GGCT)/AIG2-like uncharacterized protein YtfP